MNCLLDGKKKKKHFFLQQMRRENVRVYHKVFVFILWVHLQCSNIKSLFHHVSWSGTLKTAALKELSMIDLGNKALNPKQYNNNYYHNHLMSPLQ